MAEYNVEINKYNQADNAYDQLYPQTKTANIIGLSPISVSVSCTITPALAGVTVSLISGTTTFSAVSNASGVAVINEVALGVYDVLFDNPDVSSATTSLNIEFYGVYRIDAVYNTTYVTYTVVIDESNSNPLTCCTYADDAAGMTKGSTAWDSKAIFNNIKPCVLKNGVVQYYLNPNDYTKKVDGTASVLTGDDGDVMVEFSKFAYRIYREGTKLYVSVTNNPNAKTEDNRWSYGAFSRVNEGDRDKMYIGAYHGYTISSALRSVSGFNPTVNQTVGACRTQAQANGTGYQQFTFYQLTALQCLFIIKYGNLNSQQALGMGYVDASAATSTGATNANGMYYGTASGDTHVKFAGIEDFWGNVYDWIDGLYSDDSRNILTSFTNYNDSGSGYTNNGQGASSNFFGWISKTQGINSNTGFIIKESNGSTTTYCADNCYLNASRLPRFGGGSDSGDFAGAFHLNVNYSASSAVAYIGARLSYC